MSDQSQPSRPATAGHRGVLFDIDGTLVDSNYLHVDAWSRAFAEVGHPVETWRIHRHIGMDSGKMLSALLGDDADALADAATQTHARLYARMADRMRLLPGAQELVRELATRGHTVMLATSAPEDELDLLLRLLDLSSEVDVVTSGDDVDTAKPAPDILHVALHRAEVSAGDAIMIGDAVWDVEAARRAGMTTIGVLSGGYGEQELLDAGAAAVYANTAALLDVLDESPIYIDENTTITSSNEGEPMTSNEPHEQPDDTSTKAAKDPSADAGSESQEEGAAAMAAADDAAIEPDGKAD